MRDADNDDQRLALWLTQAEQLHGQGRLIEAADFYGQALKLAPDHWLALMGLGVVRHALGDTVLALDLLGEALSNAPGRAEIHVNLAIAQFQIGQVDQAQASIARGLELEPKALNAYRVRGLILRQRGDSQGASAAFAAELALHPTQIEAWGDLATDLGEVAPLAARRAAERAVAAAPGRAETHYVLGRALQLADQPGAARRAYASGLALNPGAATLHLGVGLALVMDRALEVALAPYRRAALIEPSGEQVTFTYAKALYDLGQKEDAAEVLSTCLAHHAGFAEGHNFLAAIYRDQGDVERALPHLRRAIRLKPDLGVAYANLALALSSLGQRASAIGAFRGALACNPEEARLRGDLGALLHQDGQIDPAFELQTQALALEPGSGGGLGNFGNLLRDLGFTDHAHRVLERAAACEPTMVSNWNNHGLISMSRRELDQALMSFARAMCLAPDLEAPYNGFAGLYKDLGYLDLSHRAYARLERVAPGNAALRSNLLFLANYDASLAPQAVYALHRAWAARFSKSDAKGPEPRPRQGRKLRIGYVSGDFRQHVVTHFSEPLFTHHDRDRVELVFYDNTLLTDRVTERLKDLGDTWTKIIHLDDASAAAKIREDEIDILVDLSGHTGGNRLAMFAHKPAPVQVTALGYPNTTGMDAIDYRLSDRYADPPGLSDEIHAEKIIRLATGFNCYRPPPDSPGVTPPPAMARGYVTFGCFNNFTKVSPATLGLWARILHAVPGSRLLLRSIYLDADLMRARVLRDFQAHGIGPERLELRGWTKTGHHFDAYGEVDIALDPYPYNGTTTTCDALWMGVAMITLAGQVHVGRVGVSLLSRIGADDWIAKDEADYLAIACRLAGDLDGLAKRRTAQRAIMAQAICDGAAYAKAVEDAYDMMIDEALAKAEANKIETPVPVPNSRRTDIETKIASLPYWYHKIDLPEGETTPGWAPLMPEAYDIPERLDGLRVLDIGAWDGYWSFEALRRGARQVVAIDDFSDYLGSLEPGQRRAWQNFDLCREILGYGEDMCQRIDMSVYDATPERLGTFDVIFFFGTVYHLRHPLLALDRIADLATGSLHVESAILDLASGYRGLNRGYAQGDVVAEFYPGREYGNNDTNWWAPTLRCLGAWLEAAGFDEVEAWLLTERPLHLGQARGFARGIKRGSMAPWLNASP